MFGSTRGDNRPRPVGRLAGTACIAVMLLGMRQAGAEAPPLWGRLTPGPHAVGFRSKWELDHSRTYNTTFGDKTRYAAGKAPRPVLVNVWYPAERSGDARPMLHGGYFEIASDDPRLGKFAAELTDYARGVVRKELFDKSAAAMSERERRLLERLWATPTACTRNARPLDRKGPLVIYHGGAGSSYEDNSVLCEFLASHGYVVVGSAFQDASGATLNIGGGGGSTRDLAFLIGYASRLPFADWGRVAVAGHSAGAQASLVYASRESTPVDAVVSLDTTQDYYSLSDRGWKSFVPTVRESSRNITMPVLFAANACAVFELADSLAGSERDYLTFKDLGHNDYISQGIFKRTLASWPDAGKDTPRAAAAPGSPEASYEALCVYVLAFLDTRLRGDPSRQGALDATYRTNTLGGNLPHVEHVPAGVTAAGPYRDAPGKPPEPRQVRSLLEERGLEATVAILKSAREEDPEAPVFNDTFGYALVYELLEKGRTPDAAAFHRLYISFDPGFRRRLVTMGKSFLRYGMKSQALDLFEKAAALDPNDAEAAEQVKSLRGALKAR
jgi:pimeloyl-ACP methyl ester carboxylesterase